MERVGERSPTGKLHGSTVQSLEKVPFWGIPKSSTRVAYYHYLDWRVLRTVVQKSNFLKLWGNAPFSSLGFYFLSRLFKMGVEKNDLYWKDMGKEQRKEATPLHNILCNVEIRRAPNVPFFLSLFQSP